MTTVDFLVLVLSEAVLVIVLENPRKFEASIDEYDYEHAHERQ